MLTASALNGMLFFREFVDFKLENWVAFPGGVPHDYNLFDLI